MMAALAPPPGSKSTAARAVLMSSDFIAFIFQLPVVTQTDLEQPNDAQSDHAK